MSVRGHGSTCRLDAQGVRGLAIRDGREKRNVISKEGKTNTSGVSALKYLFRAPALITLFALLLIVAVVLVSEGGDPLAFARLGTRFSVGDPSGTEGYDGQFVYYIAVEPAPGAVAEHLDVPAYRYQRILMPIFGRVLGLGNPSLIAWALITLGVAAHTAGTWAVGELLEELGADRRYALVYGLWAGFLLGVRLDVPEPLAYALVAGALLTRKRERLGLSWFLYALAAFAKEVTILFMLAQLAADLLAKRWKPFMFGTLALVPFALFQVWLWAVFGQPGIASGGAMATPFEWIPFMGLLRIGEYSMLYLAAMLVVFGPTIIGPAIWGIWRSVRLLLRSDRNVIVLALLTNALAIAALPFSTFRETGGLLRVSSGLILALLLFAARYSPRVLRYSVLWLALNAILLK